MENITKIKQRNQLKTHERLAEYLAFDKRYNSTFGSKSYTKKQRGDGTLEPYSKRS